MSKKLEDAFEAVIEGARTNHLGRFLRKQSIQIAGLKKIDQGMKIIDECPETRDILIPLLTHTDPSVRVTVASALLMSKPDLALPILRDIATNCPTIAQRSAGLVLTCHKVFGPGVMSICRPDPRYPIPEGYKHDEAFVFED